jgi:hypothetical protein
MLASNQLVLFDDLTIGSIYIASADRITGIPALYPYPKTACVILPTHKARIRQKRNRTGRSRHAMGFH